MRHFSATGLLFILFLLTEAGFAADRVRFAYPAKSLNYLPITIGRDNGMFRAEGIDLQMVLVASTIQVIGVTAIGSSTDTLARFLVSKNGLTPDRESRLSARERRRIFSLR